MGSMCVVQLCVNDGGVPNTDEKQHLNKNLNLTLYTDLFDDSDHIKPYWQYIERSEFRTIVLWRIHVAKNGDLWYNDNKIVCNGVLTEEFGPNHRNIAAKIKSLQLTNKRVIFSIGSSMKNETVPFPTTWHNIVGLQRNNNDWILFDNFKVLLDAPEYGGVGIDGFDSNCCEWGDESDFNVQCIMSHVKLFVYFHKNGAKILTFVPPSDDSWSFWIAICKQIYQQNESKQIINWFTLQIFGGATFETYLNAIKQYAKEMGLNDEKSIKNFIIPMYNAMKYESPQSLESQFKNIKKKVNGGAVWNLLNWKNPTDNIQKYCDGIINGLN